MRLLGRRRLWVTMAEPAVLPYAVRRPTRWCQAVLWAFLGLAIAVPAKRCCPVAWAQANVLARQRACLTWVAPAGTVVFARSTSGVAESPPPGCATALQPDLVGANAMVSRPDPANPVLYAGGLVNRHGRRLVVVSLGHGWEMCTSDDGPIPCDVLTVAPVGWTGRPEVVWQGRVEPPGRQASAPAATVMVSAGRVDPAAPSDFVAEFTVDGRTGHLRGHLGDDDRVTLTDESPGGDWQRTARVVDYYSVLLPTDD